MKDLETIGRVTISYNESGSVDNFSFKGSDMSGKMDDPLTRQLSSLPSADSAEILQSNADLVMAAWFSRINDFELADREAWTIESRIINCDEYPSGSVKTCELEYTFKKRTA